MRHLDLVVRAPPAPPAPAAAASASAEAAAPAAAAAGLAHAQGALWECLHLLDNVVLRAPKGAGSATPFGQLGPRLALCSNCLRKHYASPAFAVQCLPFGRADVAQEGILICKVGASR